jgi:hypothetical protein
LAILRKAIESAPKGGPAPTRVGAEIKGMRKDILRAWLKLLASAEKHVDPKFNPRDAKQTPSLHVIPRRNLDLPGARAEYEADVKINEEIGHRWNYQLQLRVILDGHLTFITEVFLASHYATSPEYQRTITPADRKEFEEVLGEAAISDARKEKLRGIVEGKRRPADF